MTGILRNKKVRSNLHAKFHAFCFVLTLFICIYKDTEILSKERESKEKQRKKKQVRKSKERKSKERKREELKRKE